MPTTFPAYTQPLWSGGPSTTGGLVNSPAVPTGFIWVVQSVCLWNTNNDFSYAGNAWLTDGTSHPICGVGARESQAGVFYVFTELRQALVAGNTMRLQTNFLGWWWRISGYVLTA